MRSAPLARDTAVQKSLLQQRLRLLIWGHAKEAYGFATGRCLVVTELEHRVTSHNWRFMIPPVLPMSLFNPPIHMMHMMQIEPDGQPAASKVSATRVKAVLKLLSQEAGFLVDPGVKVSEKGWDGGVRKCISWQRVRWLSPLEEMFAVN